MNILDLKNDKERAAFLEDYRNRENEWYLWHEIDDMQRAFWRFDLPDDLAHGAIIVEEELCTWHYPKTYRIWTIMHWYIITDWRGEKETFGDQVASRTMVMNLIKDIQRDAKNRRKEGSK